MNHSFDRQLIPNTYYSITKSLNHWLTVHYNNTRIPFLPHSCYCAKHRPRQELNNPDEEKNDECPTCGDPVVFDDYRFVGAGPLFTHQFSHAWLDLEGLRDGPPFQCDYFWNSVIATMAHRRHCLSLRSIFPGYSENIWGITPSDSEIGYLGWGDFTRRDFDGTVVPCASAGSLMFTPEISLAALRTMHERFGPYLYGRYGFSDAFHPISRWVDPDVVGIDLGITLLSAENLRTRSVWNWFNRQPDVRRQRHRCPRH